MNETERQAGEMSERFHVAHEKLYAASKRRDPLPWEDMPESYRRRVTQTFEWLLREGSVSAGAGLGFQQRPVE